MRETPTEGTVPHLESWEEELTDLNEAIHRQVHPRFFDEGIISAQAFAPSDSDERKLSCTRSSIVSAKAATEHFRNDLRRETAGAAELKVAEVTDESSRCVDDSRQTDYDLPLGHCFIDFRVFNDKSARRSAREAFAEIATERGLIA